MARNRDARERARRQAESQSRKIRNAALGVAVVVIAALVWVNWPAGNPAPVQTSDKQWSAPPPMRIDTSKEYLATVKLAKGGEFVIQLLADKVEPPCHFGDRRLLLLRIELDDLLDPPGRARRRGAFFGVVVAGFIHQRGCLRIARDQFRPSLAGSELAGVELAGKVQTTER